MITKQELEGLYLGQHLTMAEIGKVYGLTRQRIHQLIRSMGIDTRTAERFTASCIRCNKTFSTTRGHYRKHSNHYCSLECYLSDRKNEHYQPHRNGQRHARAIMTKHIGRPLLKGEVVHHIDGNCNNNTIDNLMFFPSHSAHIRHHHILRIAGAGEKSSNQ